MTKKMKTRAYMKAKALILWALLSAFVLYPLQPAQAYEGELSKLSDNADKTPAPETPNTWGKWLYFDKGDYVSVCGYTGTDGNITIPDNINGKPVTELSAHNTGTFEEPLYMFFEEYNENTSNLKVPEGVVLIDANTFYNCANLKSIDLPKSLLCIGKNAFQFCEGLTSLTVPENVISIDDGAFYNSGLTEIYLPNGLKTIGYSAFTRTPLTHISIPDSVTYIGWYAFESCLLEEITLPAGLAALETGLFSDCPRLKRVYVNEGTVSVMANAFFNCSKLEEVYFPSTLRKADNVFHKNKNLKTVYFAASGKECKQWFGSRIIETLTVEEKILEMNAEASSEYSDEDFGQSGEITDYSNVELVFDTPVPLAEHEYPEEPLKLGTFTIILIAASILFFILTVIFLIMFIRKQTELEAARAEEKRREEEAYHPEVLGVWECKKCRTPNSPIGNYCYKCGRKR